MMTWHPDNPYAPKDGSDPHPVWRREAIAWEADSAMQRAAEAWVDFEDAIKSVIYWQGEER